GLRADQDDVEAAPDELEAYPLGVDLRLAVVADADERGLLRDRVDLRDAVDGRRRDEDDAADARLARGREHRRGAVDVRRPDRLAGCLDRERRRGMDEDVGAGGELGRAACVPDVAAELLDLA